MMLIKVEYDWLVNGFSDMLSNLANNNHNLLNMFKINYILKFA